MPRQKKVEIPSFECERGCTSCCGRILVAADEWERIVAYRRARNLPVLTIRTDDPTLCPYVQEGRCAIYEVRPLICRLYGTTKGMRCPKGRRPRKLLPREVVDGLLLAQKQRVGGRFAFVGWWPAAIRAQMNEITDLLAAEPLARPPESSPDQVLLPREARAGQSNYGG